MEKEYLIGLLIIIIVTSSLGCVYMSKEIIKPNDNNWTQKGVNYTAQSNNKFAIDLYLRYAHAFKDENIFFSPYSISSAFAMVYEGARGKTAEEIKDVFCFPNDTTELRTSFAHIYNILNVGSSNYTLRTANALWAQEDFPFSQNYLNVAKNYYGGKVTNVDFVSNREKARHLINNWVEEQTNGKIKDLIPKGTLDGTTRLVLTNAIYFKGNWTNQFDKNATREDTFYSPNGTINVSMMYTKRYFSYFENDEVQVLELPYNGGNLSMILFLPKGNLDNFENDLSLEKIENLIQQLHINVVRVYLPKFKFETKYFMVDDLREMGMPTPFSPDADFTGMSSKNGLFIKDVIHQAYIDVNEEGTEAAAATSISVEITAIDHESRNIVFRADRPFMFLVLEKNTGEILFMGHVTAPRYE